jgi:hypothetical protein
MDIGRADDPAMDIDPRADGMLESAAKRCKWDVGNPEIPLTGRPVLRTLPPIAVEDFVLGVGPTHIAVYKELLGETHVREWRDDELGGALRLLDCPPFEAGTMPIVEVSETHVMRFDADGFVYMWSLETCELVYTARCLREVDGSLLQYSPRAATHTTAAIVITASPDAETTVVAVCTNWLKGNRDFEFFESRIPNVTSITATHPTKFFMTADIGVATLSIATPVAATWALLPYSRINTALMKDDEKRLYGDLVAVSRYMAQGLRWHHQFGRGQAPTDLDVVAELNARVYPVLDKAIRPVHCCPSDGQLVMVSTDYTVCVNTDALSMSIEKSTCDEPLIACTAVGNTVIAVTALADIVVCSGSETTVTPATAFTEEHKHGLYSLQTRPAVPPNGLLRVYGDTLAVNLYQPHLFLFHVGL